MSLIFSNFQPDGKIAVFTLHLPCIRGPESFQVMDHVDLRNEGRLYERLSETELSMLLWVCCSAFATVILQKPAKN